MKRGTSHPRQTTPLTRLHMVLYVACALALVSLCLEYGFTDPLLPVAVLVVVQLLAVGVYLLLQVLDVARTENKAAAIRHRWFDVLLIVVCAGVLAVEIEVTGQPVLKVSTIYVATLQAVLLARFGIGVVRFNLALSERRLRPARMMVSSFLVVIVVGAVLLSLPKAMSPEFQHEEGDYLYKRLLNCLFTSVSATCVTGLTVYDTGSDFSRFGQVVILVLIQVGGLGIMILGSMFGILVGRQLSLRQSLALQDALSHKTLGRVRQMVVFVVAVTFVCELVGAAVLYSMWPR